MASQNTVKVCDLLFYRLLWSVDLYIKFRLPRISLLAKHYRSVSSSYSVPYSVWIFIQIPEAVDGPKKYVTSDLLDVVWVESWTSLPLVVFFRLEWWTSYNPHGVIKVRIIQMLPHTPIDKRSSYKNDASAAICTHWLSYLDRKDSASIYINWWSYLSKNDKSTATSTHWWNFLWLPR